MHTLSFPGAVLFFLVGVSSSTWLPSVSWAVLIPVSLFAAMLWIKFPRYSFFTIFVFGVVWAAFRVQLVLNEALPPELNNEVVNITAEIMEVPEQYPQKTQILVRARNVRFNGQNFLIPGLVRLALYHSERHFRPGEIWKFSAKLKKPHGFSNPGLFDYEKFLFHKRVRATGYVKNPESSERVDSGSGHFSVNRIRQEVQQSIYSGLHDSPSDGLLVALATGIRAGITPAQWDTMRATGTNHLMAISGLHIGLIAGVVYWLFLKIWSFSPRLALWLPAQKAAVAPAIFAAVVYAALAGFNVPVQRALIMLIIALLVLAMNRKTEPAYVLSLALMGVLLFDPLSVLAAGFWLSFAAVAIITWAIAGHSRRSKTGQAIFVQVAVSLGLIPVLLLFFGQFSLVSPLANLVAVPVIGLLVTPMVLAGVALHYFGLNAVSTQLWDVAAQLVSWLWQWLSMLSVKLPLVSVPFSPETWTVPLAIFGVMLLLTPKGLPGRWIGLVWMLPLFVVRPVSPAQGEIRLTVLDVGQGLAIVVQSENNTLVYDVGRRFSDRFDTGADIVAPYLRRLGVNHVDQLIVSHEDSDHRGGVPGLRKEFPVNVVYSSVPAVIGDAQFCRSGQHWRDGTVEYRMLSPDDRAYQTDEKDNNLSCVLRISGPFGAILLPGDIEKATEQELVQEYGETLRSDVLLVPHHGSKTSSSSAFIDAVNPQLAVYSAGLGNRFHHPHARVMNRYRDRHIDTLNTAWSGAISVFLNSDGLNVEQNRLAHRHFWQLPLDAFTVRTELLHSSAH